MAKQLRNGTVWQRFVVLPSITLWAWVIAVSFVVPTHGATSRSGAEITDPAAPAANVLDLHEEINSRLRSGLPGVKPSPKFRPRPDRSGRYLIDSYRLDSGPGRIKVEFPLAAWLQFLGQIEADRPDIHVKAVTLERKLSADGEYKNLWLCSARLVLWEPNASAASARVPETGGGIPAYVSVLNLLEDLGQAVNGAGIPGLRWARIELKTELPQQARTRPMRSGIPAGQISVVYPSDPMVVTRIEKAINEHTRHVRVVTYRSESERRAPGHELARFDLQYKQYRRRRTPQAVAELFTGGKIGPRRSSL